MKATDPHADLVEPVVTAVSTVMRELLGTEPAVQTVSQPILQGTLAELSAVIPLTAAGADGALVLGCRPATAAVLAGRLLREVQQDADPSLVNDSLGEIANVIAGQLKALLFGTPYQPQLSPPTISCDAGYVLWPPPGRACLAVTFSTDAGEVTVQLFLTSGEGRRAD
jgi:CheY-specific phosphatase CheX